MSSAVFVGGKEFDAPAVIDFLRTLPEGTLVVTGDGLGLERWVAEQAVELGFQVFKPPVRHDLYDYEETVEKDGEKKTRKVRRAKDIQVYDLFIEALGSTLVLVGKGTRVSLARDKLKQSLAWPVEVVEL